MFIFCRARLLLFYSAKKVLAEGLRIIGVEPLDQMWSQPAY